MNYYETIVIFKPNEDIAKPRIRKYLDLLQSYQHEKRIECEQLGIKNLAYEVKKHKQGYYAVFTWLGTMDNVYDLERQFRIDDDVLKFMTVNLDPDSDSALNLKDLNPVLTKSEQNKRIDAIDVLLGFVNYVK